MGEVETVLDGKETRGAKNISEQGGGMSTEKHFGEGTEDESAGVEPSWGTASWTMAWFGGEGVDAAEEGAAEKVRVMDGV